MIKAIRNYFAWLRHLREEELDTATSGLHGYWKREPYWPVHEAGDAHNG